MKLDKVTSVIDEAIRKHDETGAAFVLTQNGKNVYSYSAGKSNIERNAKFRDSTICRAYSCTKVVTAVACMILVEQGKLDTSDELSWYIPEFSEPFYIRDGRKHQSPPIKIRDLLNMTSGIPYPGDSREGGAQTSELWGRLEQSIQDGDPMSTQEFAAEAGKCPLMFPAGQEWMYGASADILGAVIEKVSDMKLSEFMKQNIFDPLGMKDTAFYVPPEKGGRLAVLYDGAGENPKKCEYVNLSIHDCESDPIFQSGGAGLFSTAYDFAKLGAELSYGGAGILSRRMIEFMHENGLSPEQKRTLNWDSTRGFGYANLMRSLEDRNLAGLLATEGAFGWDGWTGTYLLCDTELGLSLTLFVQRAGAGTSRLSRCLVNAVYSSL